MTAGGAEPGARIVCITPNPAIDITLGTGLLAPGESHAMQWRGARLGGKGINSARVLASVGVPVVAMGPLVIGDCPDAGAGAPVWRFTPTRAATRRSVALVEDSGRATVLNERGGGHDEDTWVRLARDVEDVLDAAEADVVTINGSLPPDAPEELLDTLIGLVHRYGAVAIVDTSGPALVRAARAGADWLKPNESELMGISPDGSWQAGVRLLRAAGARNLLVSRGPSGVLAILESGRCIAGVPPQDLQGNPTGAGDAAVAGLAESLSRGDEMESAVRRAVAYSASAVLVDRAGELSPQWQEILPDVLIRAEEELT